MNHSPLVSKIRCYTPNKVSSASRNKNYLLYIATREGVDLSKELTDEQLKMELKYLEENPDATSVNKTKNGLFGNVQYDTLLHLSKEMYKMTRNGKVIYNGIVSLTESDAAYIGYTDKQKWVDFLNLKMPDIAEQFHIPIQNMQWVAAYHKEQGHPHCHYMLWDSSNRVRSPFIPPKLQDSIRKDLSKEIFSELRQELSLEKTAARDYLIDINKNTFEAVNDFVLEQRKLKESANSIPKKITYEQLECLTKSIEELKNMLPESGRITYQLVPPDVKQKANEIVSWMIRERTDIRMEYTSYIKSAEMLAKANGANKTSIQYAISNAKADIEKRLANIVLTSAKNLRFQETNLEYKLTHEYKNQLWLDKKMEFMNQKRTEMQITNSCRLVKSVLSCFTQNEEYNAAMQNEYIAKLTSRNQYEEHHKNSHEQEL